MRGVGEGGARGGEGGVWFGVEGNLRIRGRL